METAFSQVMTKTGRVDVAFANAGIAGHPREIDSLDLAEWRRVLSINLDGAFLTMRAAARIMKLQGAGKIIATASTWGFAARGWGRSPPMRPRRGRWST